MRELIERLGLADLYDLLEKLDGKKEETLGDIFVRMSPKDSGDEKSVGQVVFESPKGDLSDQITTDSKEPEPKYDPYNRIKEGYKIEPREKKYDYIAYHQGDGFFSYDPKTHIIVKREDLQFLINELEGFIIDDYEGTVYFKRYMEKIFRIKEEYNIV